MGGSGGGLMRPYSPEEKICNVTAIAVTMIIDQFTSTIVSDRDI